MAAKIFNDSRLIFLISQPRSGSSMLQQLLIQAENITSKPEPWMMLPLIYSYKKNVFTGGYNQSYGQVCLNDYLLSIENGVQDYKSKIKKLALDLYEKSCSSDELFLDKTPRYYHISEELMELFPKAKFLFLSRNPIATFMSIVNYNFRGRLDKIFTEDRLHDIFDAIHIISKIKKQNHTNALFINYENLVQNPITELEKIFQFLKVKTPANIGTYQLNHNFEQAHNIDKKSLHKHNDISSSYINSWKTQIKNTQEKKILLEYLQLINAEDLKVLGYPNIEEQIEKIPVKRTFFDISLKQYLNERHKIKYHIKSNLRRKLYN